MKSNYELPTQDEVLAKLTPEEHIQYLDYCNFDEIGKRQAIWAYAKGNMPIPIELLPILVEILNKGILRKHYQRTKNRTIFLEVFHKIQEQTPQLSVEDACYSIGQKYSQSPDSIRRIYNAGKYSELKKRLTKGVKNQKN